MAVTAMLAALASAGSYTIIDLGTLAGESHAFALAHASGGLRIAGSSTDTTAHFQALRYSPAPVGISRLPGYQEATGHAIDASGRVVGTAYNLGDMTWHAFSDDGTSVNDLGAFAARSINSAGDIAGTTTVITSTFGDITLPRACVWRSGLIQVLPTLGGSSAQALSIDDSGRVAGSSMNTGDHYSRPCVWTNGVAADPGTLGGNSGQIYSVRGNTAVGASQLAGGLMHATLWTLSASGTALSRTDLGALPSTASSVARAFNASGDIVGTSAFHAVLWHAGIATDLNSVASKTGWVLETAWDIDDAGRIVGSGSLYGFPRAFLLVPGNCPGDLNGDSQVDDSDFVIFAAAYDLLVCSDPAMPAGCPADLNFDGTVDDADFVLFVTAYNALVCP